MKVLIVTGGLSSERKISFMSAREVKKALKQNGHKVKVFDLKKGYQQLKELVNQFDVVFPVLHGEEGEGGELQKFLSKLNKPYVGGDWKGFKKGWYKIPFKMFCDKNGIPTAPWERLALQGSSLRGYQAYSNQIRRFGFPCVLKASNGGSSREVVILKSAQDLNNESTTGLRRVVSSCCLPSASPPTGGTASSTDSKSVVLRWNNKDTSRLLNSKAELFLEQYLEGIEVTVGILGNRALPVIEIVPPDGGWFDYHNKYSGTTKELSHAPSLTEKQRRQVQQLALKIHQTLGLGPYSRIDFIIASHISSGKVKPYVLEVNTIPGLTNQSLFPKAALAAGLDFNALIKKLVNLAVKNEGNL